jgi:hypothetical protein
MKKKFLERGGWESILLIIIGCVLYYYLHMYLGLLIVFLGGFKLGGLLGEEN